MQNHSYLSSLPTEYLRLITSFLPFASAVQFVSASKRIRQACDDWTVWREVLKNDSDFPFEIPKHAEKTKDIYKIFGFARGKTYKSQLHNNIQQYPAQLIAHQRKLGTES
jgi:hypothetical protein